MRFLILAIVLAFPVFDLMVTVRFAHWTGTPLWAWLGLSMVAGILLLRNERLAFRARTVAALHGDALLLRGLLDSGRKVLAGILLVLPGIVSDVIALALLLLPINIGRRYGPQPATAGGRWRRGHSIDGEFRRVE